MTGGPTKRQAGAPRFPPADGSPTAVRAYRLSFAEAQRYWPDIRSEEEWNAMQATHEAQREEIRTLLRDGTSPPEIAARLELPGDVVSRHVRAIQEELRPENIGDQVRVSLGTPPAEDSTKAVEPKAPPAAAPDEGTGRHRRRYAAEARQQVLELFRQGASVSDASRRLGIPFGTVNGWFHTFRSDSAHAAARSAAPRAAAPRVPREADPPAPPAPSTPAEPVVPAGVPEPDRREEQVLKRQLELAEIRLEAAAELRETLRVIRRQAENPPPATLPAIVVALLDALPPAGAPFPQRAQWKRAWDAMVDLVWPEAEGSEV